MFLRSGALSAELREKPVSENTIGPTLGRDTIQKGTMAVGLAFAGEVAPFNLLGIFVKTEEGVVRRQWIRRCVIIRLIDLLCELMRGVIPLGSLRAQTVAVVALLVEVALNLDAARISALAFPALVLRVLQFLELGLAESLAYVFKTSVVELDLLV